MRKCRPAGKPAGGISYSLSQVSSLRYVLSMPKAPSGAVVSMASTAADSTIGPQGMPSDSGTEPIYAKRPTPSCDK